jgi:hypothetical protein
MDCQKSPNVIPEAEDNTAISNADRDVVRLSWQAEE